MVLASVIADEISVMWRGDWIGEEIIATLRGEIAKVMMEFSAPIALLRWDFQIEGCIIKMAKEMIQWEEKHIQTAIYGEGFWDKEMKSKGIIFKK